MSEVQKHSAQPLATIQELSKKFLADLTESSETKLAELTGYIDERIARTQESGGKTTVLSNIRSLLEAHLQEVTEVAQQFRGGVRDVVANWNILHKNWKALKDSNAAEELAEVTADLDAANERLGALEQERDMLSEQLEASKARQGHKFSIPVPAASLFDAVSASEIVILTQSHPDDIETRIEWLTHPVEGAVGIAVFLNHATKPWIFPFHEAIADLELATGKSYDDSDPESQQALLSSVLTTAIALADSLCASYGALEGLPSNAKPNRNESDRLDDSEIVSAPMNGSNVTEDIEGRADVGEEDESPEQTAEDIAAQAPTAEGDDDLIADDE